MKTVRTTKRGIRHLTETLRDKLRTTTRVTYWDIPHEDSHAKNICLKIGRYKKIGTAQDTPEVENPKSELTLDRVEFQNLVKVLRDNYVPFKEGFNKYIPIDGKFNPESINYLEEIVGTPEKQKVLDFILKNDILADELVAGLQNRLRAKAVQEFETMLGQDLVEQNWQAWFKRNDWVLGSDFVRVLDERAIDTRNITDYLMQAYDGFLDVVEIKKPEGKLRFWADAKDHENYVQSSALTKAITQATKYIYELEREANSAKFLDRVGVKVIKPRCILIFGRSYDWDDEQKEAYRILNSSYHSLTIMTYDHVLGRAKRILGVNRPEDNQDEDAQIPDSDGNDDDIPF